MVEPFSRWPGEQRLPDLVAAGLSFEDGKAGSITGTSWMQPLDRFWVCKFHFSIWRFTYETVLKARSMFSKAPNSAQRWPLLLISKWMSVFVVRRLRLRICTIPETVLKMPTSWLQGNRPAV